MNYREKMREQINKYPYGEYYGLKPNQPKDIIRLLNEMDNADEYIKKIFFEKENLQSKIESLEEDVEYWKEKYKELENSLNNDYDPEIEVPQIHGEGISW